jgi:hypothetical protein
MSTFFYSHIDWQQAWFNTVRPVAQTIIAADSWRDALNAQARERGLRNHLQLPIDFVQQEDLPAGMAYEEFIGAHGKVPTRENLHDFFNAMVWLTFPLIKRQLNALQAAQIAVLGVGKERGPARDAATIFDENSALLVAEDSDAGRELVAALREHQWMDAFVDQREKFATGDVLNEAAKAEVWLFGHALMEKLVAPYKAITAHTWVVFAPANYFQMDRAARQAWLDQRGAAQLAQIELTNAMYTPLPVLGVPGWWTQQDVAFYEDVSVFRPKRVR